MLSGQISESCFGLFSTGMNRYDIVSSLGGNSKRRFGSPFPPLFCPAPPCCALGAVGRVWRPFSSPLLSCRRPIGHIHSFLALILWIRPLVSGVQPLLPCDINPSETTTLPPSGNCANPLLASVVPGASLAVLIIPLSGNDSEKAMSLLCVPIFHSGRAWALITNRPSRSCHDELLSISRLVDSKGRKIKGAWILKSLIAISYRHIGKLMNIVHDEYTSLLRPFKRGYVSINDSFMYVCTCTLHTYMYCMYMYQTNTTKREQLPQVIGSNPLI